MILVIHLGNPITETHYCHLTQYNIESGKVFL